MAENKTTKQALTWEIVAVRTTVYRVQAVSAESAELLMIAGAAEEVDQTTNSIKAVEVRLCPICQDTLTDRATCNGRPTYCDTCDREVAHDDEGNV